MTFKRIHPLTTNLHTVCIAFCIQLFELRGGWTKCRQYINSLQRRRETSSPGATRTCLKVATTNIFLLKVILLFVALHYSNIPKFQRKCSLSRHIIHLPLRPRVSTYYLTCLHISLSLLPSLMIDMTHPSPSDMSNAPAWIKEMLHSLLFQEVF